MPADVICVSRALGAGGEEVGRLVAERLGFRRVDEEILAVAAEKEHLDPAELTQVEKRRSVLGRLLDDFVSGGTLADSMRALIRDAIEETAAEGKVVIVAHGASIALAGRPGLLRVLVTGSRAVREMRLAAEERSGEAHAAGAIEESDRNRADYLRSFYGVEEHPTDYDLVLNTDRLSPATAAELVVEAARAIGD